MALTDLAPTDFPENIVAELKASLESLGFDKVMRRPLRPTDPHLSAAVFAVDWNPEEMQIGQHDPAVTRYLLSIQTFIKHGDDEVGTTLHARIAKKVRVMLYRDEALRVRLGQLRATEDGVTERLQRWGVRTQRYLSNEVDATFLYLAVTELWVDTEIV